MYLMCVAGRFTSTQGRVQMNTTLKAGAVVSVLKLRGFNGNTAYYRAQFNGCTVMQVVVLVRRHWVVTAEYSY